MKTPGLVFLVICAVCGADNNPTTEKPAPCCDVSLAMAVGALTEKMTQVEKELTELKKITSAFSGIPKVAFSATLYATGSGNTGPFSIDTPLKYKKVFANFGRNYNPETGMFTATVKGVYFFRFSMHNNHSPQSVVSLMKNDVRVVTVWDQDKADSNDTGSNAAVLPLVVGDTVYVKLWAERLVYDDEKHYNTFTGFLLFTN